jgi:hypothetical protein
MSALLQGLLADKVSKGVRRSIYVTTQVTVTPSLTWLNDRVEYAIAIVVGDTVIFVIVFLHLGKRSVRGDT